ncbi:IS3 family transposase [Saccharothrix lopnurensis]|uniref:IS3 family transposase n=1 Tax=Saccharothrix lopnurensis TaxID=1670621 RepID=A0ABW1P8N8_9PSEU
MARQADPSRREREDEVITAGIVDIHAASGGTYGSPRVHQVLRRRGIRVSRKRVERLMRRAGLPGAFLRRQWRASSTRRDPRAAPAPDRVNRGFTAPAPDRLWVADATGSTPARAPSGPSPCPNTAMVGVRPRRPQVRALGGRNVRPASSSKHSQAFCSAATVFPRATSPAATSRPLARRARPRGASAPAGKPMRRNGTIPVTADGHDRRDGAGSRCGHGQLPAPAVMRHLIRPDTCGVLRAGRCSWSRVPLRTRSRPTSRCGATGCP